MNLYTNFLIPAEPYQVVGQRNHEKRFESILAEFKNGKYSNNMIVVSGSPGIGKTSLLKVFAEIAEGQMAKFVFIPLNMGTMNQKIFQDTYSAISNYLVEEKKGGFLRKKSKELPIKTYLPKSKISDILTPFIANLETRPPKSSIVITYDPFDRVLDSGQKFIIDGIISLSKAFKDKFPILFIISCQEYNISEIKDLLHNSQHFLLDRLDFSDAKLLLSKRAKGKLQTSTILREELVKQSDRNPFNLVFIIDVVQKIEDKIKKDGLSESEGTILEMASPYIRNFAIRAFVNEIMSITEEENKAIKQLLGSSRNAIAKETIESAKIPSSIMESLEQKGLIKKYGNFYQFVSYALFASLGSGLSTVDIQAEAGLLLQILETDMVMGHQLNTKILERLEQVSLSTEGFDDQSIPNRSVSLYQSAFEIGRYYEAYRIALLAGAFHEMAKNIEGSGLFFEECAQNYQNQGKEEYTIALYRKSLEAFQQARNERKKKDIAQRTGMIYLQKGDRFIKQQHVELARSAYFHSFKLFERAEDINSAQKVANKALQTYSNKKESAQFFRRLLDSIVVAQKVKDER